MARLESITSDIFSIFGSLEWTTLGIPTYPQNFVNNDSLDEFVRVSFAIGPGASSVTASQGLMKVEIYTPVGQSIDRAVEIGENLNNLFERLTIGGLQFMHPELSHTNQEFEEDPTLFRSLYSISFNYYGV